MQCGAISFSSNRQIALVNSPLMFGDLFMADNKRLSEIKRIIDRYLLTLTQRPNMLGTIEEIEGSFSY
jgi:hypothetical protein